MWDRLFFTCSFSLEALGILIPSFFRWSSFCECVCARMLFLNPRTVTFIWLVANVYFENQLLLLQTSFIRERIQILKPFFYLKNWIFILFINYLKQGIHHKCIDDLKRPQIYKRKANSLSLLFKVNILTESDWQNLCLSDIQKVGGAR